MSNESRALYTVQFDANDELFNEVVGDVEARLARLAQMLNSLQFGDPARTAAAQRMFVQSSVAALQREMRGLDVGPGGVGGFALSRALQIPQSTLASLQAVKGDLLAITAATDSARRTMHDAGVAWGALPSGNSAAQQAGLRSLEGQAGRVQVALTGVNSQLAITAARMELLSRSAMPAAMVRRDASSGELGLAPKTAKALSQAGISPASIVVPQDRSVAAANREVRAQLDRLRVRDAELLAAPAPMRVLTAGAPQVGSYAHLGVSDPGRAARVAERSTRPVEDLPPRVIQVGPRFGATVLEGAQPNVGVSTDVGSAAGGAAGSVTRLVRATEALGAAAERAAAETKNMAAARRSVGVGAERAAAETMAAARRSVGVGAEQPAAETKNMAAARRLMDSGLPLAQLKTAAGYLSSEFAAIEAENTARRGNFFAVQPGAGGAGRGGGGIGGGHVAFPDDDPGWSQYIAEQKAKRAALKAQAAGEMDLAVHGPPTIGAARELARAGAVSAADQLALTQAGAASRMVGAEQERRTQSTYGPPAAARAQLQLEQKIAPSLAREAQRKLGPQQAQGLLEDERSRRFTGGNLGWRRLQFFGGGEEGAARREYDRAETAGRRENAARDAQARAQAARDQREGVSGIVNEKSAYTENFHRQMSGDQGVGPMLRGLAGGPSGSFRGEFAQGFRGMNENIPAQLGQAAKFSIFYGSAYKALNLVNEASSQALQGVKDYADAVTALSLVTSRSEDSNRSFAESLAQAGVAAGFTGAEGVQAGARALGLMGLTEAPEPIQKVAANQSAAVSLRTARITGGDPAAIQTLLAGVGKSFGYSPLDQSKLEDQLAYISKRTGRDTNDLLQGAAQIGQLGQSAGFTPEQVFAMVGKISGQTAQSAQAVAGNLGQVFSRAGDPSVAGKLRDLGVKTNGTTLAQQIEQLSGMNLNRDQLNVASQVFGRGRSQQAMQILTSQFGQINELAGGARSVRPGFGEDQFNRVMGTIGNQMRLLGARAMELGRDLASTGILDLLGVLVKVANELIQPIDAVVKGFNELPRGLRGTMIAMAELYVAMNLISTMRGGAVGGTLLRAGAARVAGGARAVRALGTEAGAVGAAAATGNTWRRFTSARVGFSAAGEAGAAAAAGGAGAATGAVGAAGGRAARLAGRVTAPVAAAGGWSEALGLAGASVAAPVLAATAALVVAFVGLKGATDELSAAQHAARDAGRAAGDAKTPEAMREAAGLYRQAREAARQQTDFTWRSKDSLSLGLGTLFNALPGSGARRQMKTAGASEEELNRRADALDKALNHVMDVSPQSGFGGGSNQEVQAGLADLADRGYSAAQQLNLLNVSFDALVRNADKASGSVATVFKGQGGVFGEAAGAAASSALVGPGGVSTQLRDKALAANPLATASIESFLTPAGVIRAFANEELKLSDPKKYNKSSGLLKEAQALEGKVDIPGLQTTVAGDTLDYLKKSGRDPEYGAVNLTTKDVKAMTAIATADVAAAAKKKGITLTQEMLQYYAGAYAGGLREAFLDFSGSQVTASNVQGIAANTPALVEAAAATAANISGGDPFAEASTRTKEYAKVVARMRAGLAAATDDDQRATIARHLQGYLDDRANPAVRAEDVAGEARRVGLAERTKEVSYRATDTVGRAKADQATAELAASRPWLTIDEQATADVAAEKARTAARDATTERDAARSRALVDPRNTEGGAAAEARILLARRAQLGREDPEYWTNMGQGNELGLRQKMLARSRVASQRTSRLSVDDTVGRSRAELATAKAELDAALPGTKEWFDAYDGVAQAQRALSQTYMAEASNRRRLGTDLTDNVAQAGQDLIDIGAEAKLASSPAAKDDVELKRRKGVDNKQGLEFTRFMGDLDIDHRLEKITDEGYIASLRAKRSRIHDRSRQEHEQIQAIDLAIKASTDALNQKFAGQWNLGDIKVPTPYEMKRAVAYQSGTPGGASVDNSTTTVTINGADFARVIAYLDATLGQAGTSTVASTGRKV